MKYLFPVVALLPLLSACDNGLDLKTLCSDTPMVCAEFEEDNWCRKERKDTIFSHWTLIQNNEDRHKANLLVAYEKYAKCMNHASKIEHIKLKQKKRIRIDNYLKAKQRIKELSEETKNSEHPELLFYHWSRYLNEKALEKFLAMEGTKQLETTQSQFNLATYYIKRDLNKTLTLLFRALELVQPNQQIDVEIFKTLTTIFTDKHEYKQAYVWLKILSIYAPEDTQFNQDSLEQYVKGYKLDQNFLDNVATSTLEKIKAGTFVSPRH